MHQSIEEENVIFFSNALLRQTTNCVLYNMAIGQPLAWQMPQSFSLQLEAELLELPDFSHWILR